MSTMTLAQLILACSLSSSPHVHNTLHRVIMASSKGQPYWIATSEGHVYTPEHVTRAEAIIEGLPNQELHIGLAALSRAHLERLDVTFTQAFDVCTHVGIASLELEGVLTAKTRSHVQAMHEALATYYDPRTPDSLSALSFGAKVLAMQEIDVEEEASAETPRPGPRYTLELSVFGSQGDPRVSGDHATFGTVHTGGIFAGEGAPKEDLPAVLPLTTREHAREDPPAVVPVAPAKADTTIKPATTQESL